MTQPPGRLRRERWMLAAVLAAAAWLAGAGSWTWRIDQTLYDAAITVTARAPDPDIVIVAIDDESLAAIGRWPWPRAVHATALDRLAGARAKAIALDLLFVEPDPDPAQDRALGDAIRRAGNVVLPAAFYAAAGTVKELLPVAALREAARIGHVDAELDADSVLRHTYLRGGPGAASYPHLALALLDAAGEKPAAAPALVRTAARPPGGAWVRDERVLIRYAGPPGTIARVSYAALLRGDLDASRLAGKFVLVGATAIGVGDAFATPVSGGATPMPGVEINANLLQALRSGETLRAASPVAIGAAAAVFAVVLLAWLARVTPRTGLIVSAGAALAAVVLGMALVDVGLWVGPTTFVLVALAAYPLWSWRRLDAAGSYLDQELVRLRAEPAVQGHPGTAAAGTLPAPADEPVDDIERRVAAVRAAGDRLRASQRLLAETLAALPEAVLVLRPDRTIELANTRAAALAGVSAAGDLRGRTPSQALVSLVPREAPTWDALLDRVAATGATVVSEAGSPARGDFLARCAPLRDGVDAPNGFVVVLTDVTRLKLAERQRDDVLGFVSHDIRSPQASLLSLVQLRRAGQLELAEDTLLEHVESLARRSLDLADEFVQVARAEAKPLALERFDPESLLDDAARDVAMQAQRRNVAIVRNPAAAGASLDGERPMLLRALVNLIGNAVKFSQAGARVTAGLSRRDGFCVFAIEDEGPGIAPEDLAMLFQRYGRVESANVLRLQPGVGLGLVFVDAVARRHGGRVAVDSKPGKGSRFELWIPEEPEPGRLHAD